MALAEADRGLCTLPRRRPESVGDFFRIVEAIEAFFSGSGVEPSDLARFSAKMLNYLCSCDARRMSEYEAISFWRYVDGDRYSPRFQSYLNSPRFMVAMDARRGSARTIGNKAIQILLDFRRPGGTNDRVLNGPTTTQWLDPWEKHLRSRGAEVHFGKELRGFDLEGERIVRARFEGGGGTIDADYFVLAVPLDRVKHCIDDALARADASLKGLRTAPDMTSWMVGAQFYLRDDVPICHGHVAYPDSPWALSSVSQAQFWATEGGSFQRRFGDGRVHGILSVDICDWDQPGSHTEKSAAQCTSEEEVLREVWRQLQDALKTDGGKGPTLLADENRLDWRLDSNVEFRPEGAINRTPLLVHPPGSWFKRPKARTMIPNLMLASDYVQTTTDLATMEGANEAARLAVNALYEHAGVSARAELWPVTEEAGFLIDLAKKIDERRWREADWMPSFATRVDEDMTLDQVKGAQQLLEERLRRDAGSRGLA
jgi:uncharacterized protein with NAD-binding domain and iron-sulfur cluster